MCKFISTSWCTLYVASTGATITIFNSLHCLLMRQFNCWKESRARAAQSWYQNIVKQNQRQAEPWKCAHPGKWTVETHAPMPGYKSLRLFFRPRTWWHPAYYKNDFTLHVRFLVAVVKKTGNDAEYYKSMLWIQSNRGDEHDTYHTLIHWVLDVHNNSYWLLHQVFIPRCGIIVNIHTKTERSCVE